LSLEPSAGRFPLRPSWLGLVPVVLRPLFNELAF